ncbi:hypothetical protein [Iamia sp. SCSIO 61187]|uniref:hypothetical protein n=1 Tax=Iamia sp. SCSIO 61187 TaxID=2722752 RepID=UPI001C63A699|nr:hypothetical protein [Iamia sp. SCSIO 61187]
MTGKPASDADVLVRSLSDPKAFGEVFDEHGDAVFGYFARRVPQTEVADLAAETFRVAFDSALAPDPERGQVR